MRQFAFDLTRERTDRICKTLPRILKDKGGDRVSFFSVLELVKDENFPAGKYAKMFTLYESMFEKKIRDRLQKLSPEFTPKVTFVLSAQFCFDFSKHLKARINSRHLKFVSCERLRLLFRIIRIFHLSYDICGIYICNRDNNREILV